MKPELRFGEAGREEGGAVPSSLPSDSLRDGRETIVLASNVSRPTAFAAETGRRLPAVQRRTGVLLQRRRAPATRPMRFEA